MVGALDALDIEKAVVMGHSWGASTALAVAAYHPDRTQGLIMVDGGFGGRRSPELTWEEFRDRLSPRDIYGPRERYLGALKQQFAHCWSDKLEQMVMSMVRVDPDGSVHERLELSNQQQMLWAMWSEPTSELMPHVQCPTLMVAAAGRLPIAYPEMLERRRAGVEAAQAAMPNARVVWVQDTGHDIGYEKPEALASAIGEFLTSL